MKPLQFILALFLAPCVLCCTEVAPKSSAFDVLLSAETDEGAPLGGVSFVSKSKAMGNTPESGSLSLRLRGAEGSTLPITVTCPEGYLSPEARSLRLVHTTTLKGKASFPIALRAICTRKLRDIVLVVHSENGRMLPVSINGEFSGKTDKNGNAHLLVTVDREIKSLAVSLDTTEHSQLLPQNPRRVFRLHGRDAVALFNQPFSLAKQKKKRPRRRHSKTRRHVPYRVH